MPQAQGAFGGTLLAGRYRLRGVLGRGGVGEVYEADDIVARAPVAVKVLHGASLDAVAILRFAREARIGLRVHHAHVIETFAVSPLESPTMFIAMELLRGQTLRRRLARGVLPPHQTRRLGIALTEGLAAVHAQGVFHRDIKASNIFLAVDPYAQDPDLGTAKLLDLGIARGESGSAEASLTTDGALVGTPSVMAPELFRGSAFDVHSEIFSLGVVLYESLIGLQPYPATTFVERLMSLDRLPPPLTRGAWDSLLMAMMAPDPRARPHSLDAVLRALAAIPPHEDAPRVNLSFGGARVTDLTTKQDDAVAITVNIDATHPITRPSTPGSFQDLPSNPSADAPLSPSFRPHTAGAADATERLVYTAQRPMPAPFEHQSSTRPLAPAPATNRAPHDRTSPRRPSHAPGVHRTSSRRKRRTRALVAGIALGAALAIVVGLLLVWKFAL